MLNKFPGKCTRCGLWLAAQAGSVEKNDAGKWLLTCSTPCEAKPILAAAPAAKVGELDGILKLFAKARTHLKFPAVSLGVRVGPFADHNAALAVSNAAVVHEVHEKVGADEVVNFYAVFPEIRVNVAGEQAKVPGSLTVTEAETRPGEERRRWLGRVLLDGTFQAAWELSDAERKAAVEARLAAFAADPSKVGAEDGKLHGRCCFCRIALSDERSTAVGYGKKCASNFGLAWGARPAEFAASAA